MTYYDIEQNSDEWMALRCGKFTASMFKDLFAKETTQTYQDAIYKIVFERLTGEVPESFSNDWMQRGHELEQEASDWYSLTTGYEVLNGGFFKLSDWIGASPDGLIGEDGLIEIKCPKYSTMINYLLDQRVPKIYEWQVQGQLYVTGRAWCDFICYHPKLKRLVLRIERDDKMLSDLEQKLNESISKADSIIEKLK